MSQASAPGAERREHKRFDINLGAEVTDGEHNFTAATRDVSSGGACLEGPRALREGSIVNVALFLVVDGIEESSMPPLKVSASVQWTVEKEDEGSTWRHLAGLKFQNISDAQKQWLESVIARAEG